MCLIDARTDRPPGQYSRAWKVLEYCPDIKQWLTPYIREAVLALNLKASGEPVFLGGLHWTEKGTTYTHCTLSQGGIHCFRDPSLAKLRAKRFSPRCDVFEVRGKGLVAWNEIEIAFREVRFLDNPDDWEV